MKRVLLLSLFAAFSITVSAQIVKDYDAPTEKSYRKAVKTIMYRTNGHDLTAKRMKAMEVTQSVMNRFTHEEWKAYRRSTDAGEVARLEQSGVPYFMRQSFDKVRNELRTTKVKEGTVAVGLLYNMGYIVKTPTATFGIDLNSRHLDEILDYIDFAMITHPHGDHNTKELREGMAKRNKPLLAAFDAKDVEELRVTDGGEYTFGDVKVRVTLGDHNKKARKYVASYEIDCGPRTNNTIIFHTGDTNNYVQLNPQKQVDIFMLHMSVGLDIQASIDKFNPHHVFLSHLQEWGHRINKWRWTFDDALRLKSKLKHDHIWIPCWGERIIYNRNDWR